MSSAQVAANRKKIDSAFQLVAGQLFRFHRSILESQGSSSIKIEPANKIKLYAEFYDVAKSHPSVASEFMDKLRHWSKGELVPDYRAALDEALATGDEDSIFNAVSRNFRCFSLVTKVTSAIFHNVNNQLAESPSQQKIASPKQVLFSAYRQNFYEKIRDKIQNIFFKRVSEVRRDTDLSKLMELRPIAEIFMHVARSTSLTLDDEAARIYQTDYVDRYLKAMVTDNKGAVQQQIVNSIPADAVADWITTRADFENMLLVALVAPENDLHRAIMRRYDDDVVAPCTVELVNDKRHGFEASFQNADQQFDSFRPAIVLFDISARVERQHPQCVRACVSALNSGVIARLKKLVIESRAQTHDNMTAHADSFVKIIMTEHRLLEQVVKSMRNHADLVKALSEAFRKVLNSDESDSVITRKIKRGTGSVEGKVSFAEVLATFVDSFLRGEEGATSGGSTSEIINSFGTLFSLIVDKDIFGEHFKLRLAKRLLQFKYDEDRELQVLEQMQRQSGKVFIHKFEGMINDVRVASTIRQQYEATKPTVPCEFEVKVLTFAYWPQIKPDENFLVPDALNMCQQSFDRYYRKKNPTRQLKWQAERGAATLDTKFPKGGKEISMNIHQASVMFAIDELAPATGGKGVTLTALGAKVGLDVSDIKPLVASMLFAKGLNLVVRVGIADEKTSLEASQCVELNPTYASRMKKIKLPHAQTAKADEGGKVDPGHIDASRAQMLDAALVRIMKARKQMKQAQLVDMVIQSCTKFFIPQPRQIKLRIEHLMQKEFLERDDDEADLYRYLA